MRLPGSSHKEYEMENDVLKQFIEWILNEKENISLCDSIEYKKGDRWVKIGIEVMGTQFNDRSTLIENVKEGDPLQILRDPDNFFDRFTLSVCDHSGQELGTMWMNLADVLSPVLDEGFAQIIESHATEVVPLSIREDGAVKPILKMEMTIFLTQEDDLSKDSSGGSDVAAAKEPETAQSVLMTQTVPAASVRERTVPEDTPAAGGEIAKITASAEAVRPSVVPVNVRKTSGAWIGVLVIGLLAWAALLGGGYYYATTNYIPSQHYRKGYDLYQQEKYTLAADELHRAGTYNGADRLLADCYRKMVSAETEDDPAEKKEDNTKSEQ